MKKLLYVFMVTIAMVSMIGCGKSDANSKGEDQTSPQAAEESNENANQAEILEVSVTHTNGTTTVPTNPKKAVVFDMSVLDMMAALEVDVEVAGPVSSIPTYVTRYENVTNAGSIKEPDMEAIFEFEPDVIFINGRQADFYDQLSEIAPTIYLPLNAETFMTDFTNNVKIIGDIFGKSEETEKAIAEIDTKVEEVKALTNASDKKGLIVLTNEGNISAYGKGSRFGIVHDVLEVKEADEAIEVSTHGQEVGYEYLAQVNPDILFVVDRTAVTSGTVLASETLNNDLVNGTVAAKNDKIITLDAECWYISSGGLTSVNKMIDEVKAAFAE